MNRTFDFSSGLPVPVPVETLAVLAERARSQGARMTVIGAVARDLVVHAPTMAAPQRATLDVDIAIAVDEVAFRTFTQGLDRVKGNEHRFIISGIAADVVPYGPIETRCSRGGIVDS